MSGEQKCWTRTERKWADLVPSFPVLLNPTPMNPSCSYCHPWIQAEIPLPLDTRCQGAARAGTCQPRLCLTSPWQDGQSRSRDRGQLQPESISLCTIMVGIRPIWGSQVTSRSLYVSVIPTSLWWRLSWHGNSTSETLRREWGQKAQVRLLCSLRMTTLKHKDLSRLRKKFVLSMQTSFRS